MYHDLQADVSPIGPLEPGSMTYDVDCPNCRRSLAVLREYVGLVVRCPACSATFATAESGPPAQAASDPVALPHQVPDQVASPFSAQETRLADGRGKNSAPALCLIIVGLMGFFADVAFVIRGAGRPMRLPPDAPAFLETMQKQAQLPEVWAAVSVCALASALIVLGAVQMLRLRWWGFAVFVSFLAIINIANGCCIPGLPIGIWSIATLVRPEVREAFQALRHNR